MNHEAAAYQSYLLRVWRADNDGRLAWRFTLQPTGGGPPLVFVSSAQLLAFLDSGRPAQVGPWPPPLDKR